MDDDDDMLTFPLGRTDSINPTNLAVFQTFFDAEHWDVLILDQHWPQFKQIKAIIFASLLHIVLLINCQEVPDGLALIELQNLPDSR